MKTTKTYPTVTCHICGASDLARYEDHPFNQMVSRSICSSCICFEADLVSYAKSLESIQRGGWASFIVVRDEEGPTRFRVGPEDVHALFRGYGGSKFVIKLDAGRVQVSSSLWSGTVIPDVWRDKFPPCGEFVYETDYLKHRQEFDRLKEMGCFYSETKGKSDEENS